MAKKNVTVIPATISMHTKSSVDSKIRRRVAAYARVSTDSDEQFTSYEAQIDYYTQYIHRHPDWEFVDVYTDEGISGTSTKGREGFNQMISDALNGKIDLIVTKSVSRFARNTVDSLTTVRKLKEAGVEVYFEKENIWTLDSKGELLITIMSSLAQEESRSISENVTWGQRKRFADGKLNIPYSQFLGYKKGADGIPEIVPEEAELVRRIYRMFLDGKAVNFIANQLTKEGVPTPAKKKVWQNSTVESILTNEKYKGDAILQKTFTVDFLSKKMKINEGEVPQYYVQNSHPAIVSSDTWNAVQIEFQRRKGRKGRHKSTHPFNGKIICADCGSAFGAKVWHSTSKYRRTIWQCNHKYTGAQKCRTPHLYTEDIEELFLDAVSQLSWNRDQIIADCRIALDRFSDLSELDTKCLELRQEAEVLSGLAQKLIDDNAAEPMDPDRYQSIYNHYLARHTAVQQQLDEVQVQRADKMEKADAISGFLFEISELESLPIEFSERLWHNMVDHVKVYEDDRLVFVFRNGIKITEFL